MFQKVRLATRRRRVTWYRCCGCAHLALALPSVASKGHASDIYNDVLSQAAQNSSVRFEIQDLADDAMVLSFC